MAEVVVFMIDPEMTGIYRGPPPKRVKCSNVFDHLACECLTLDCLRSRTGNRRQLREL